MLATSQFSKSFLSNKQNMNCIQCKDIKQFLEVYLEIDATFVCIL